MKKRNLFMSTALMCGLMTFAFRFDSDGLHWFWSDKEPVAIILVIVALTLGILWFKTVKRMKTED